MLCASITMPAQQDTLTLGYKLERCLRTCDPQVLLEYMEQNHYNREQILNTGAYVSYHGNDHCANAMMNLYFARHDSISADNWHSYSVQNTKHGNYAEAVRALEKSVALDAKEVGGYYGWVLLYYYRDYERSLKQLEHFDQLDPAVEAPVGENIHFLKGLCHYQLGNYQKAIGEFLLNDSFERKSFGQKNCNGYIYFYLARCYDQSGDTRQAEKYYKKAITYTSFPTEARYYLGMLYKYKKNDAVAGKKQIKIAYDLLLKGYKQQDIYVELFDEVYLSQLAEELKY